MNPTTIILLAGAAWLAFRYIQPALTLLLLDFSYHSFDILKIDTDYIQCSVTLRAANPSLRAVTLESISANMTLNGTPVGTINTGYYSYIQPGDFNLIKIVFNIRKSEVGAELWSMIINKQTDFVFKISGTARADGNTYPLSLTWTMRDIINMIHTN